MVNDLKSNLEFAIGLGKKALTTACRWSDYNAGKLLVEPPIGQAYEINRAVSGFKKVASVIDEVLKSKASARNVKLLLKEYETIKRDVEALERSSLPTENKPPVCFTMLEKDCEEGAALRFPLGRWALKILDIEAKDSYGQRLIDHGHFRFKGGNRTFPEASNRPAIKTWKILRALLSSEHILGVTSLAHIEKPTSVFQRKNNRVQKVESWQDHVKAVDKNGNPVNRGNGKHLYRLELNPVS